MPPGTLIAAAIATQEALQVLFIGVTVPLAFVTFLVVTKSIADDLVFPAYAVALLVGLLFVGSAVESVGPLPPILQPQNDVGIVTAIGYVYFAAYGLLAALLAGVGVLAGAVIGYLNRV